MTFINGQQPDLGRYVTDCYKMGVPIPGAAGGTNGLSVPVGNDSFAPHEAVAEGEKTESNGHTGAIVAGATALLAGAALLFKPTREWAVKNLGKISKTFGESTIKKEAAAANKEAELAVADILSDAVKTKVNKQGVHCRVQGLSKKPISFSGNQVKHLEQVEGKKGVYKVSLGLDEDGAEQFAEMTLKKAKNKKGEEFHLVTDAKKIEAGEPKVDAKPSSTGTSKAEEIKEEVKPEATATPKAEEIKDEVKPEAAATPKSEEIKGEVKPDAAATPKSEEIKGAVKSDPKVDSNVVSEEVNAASTGNSKPGKFNIGARLSTMFMGRKKEANTFLKDLNITKSEVLEAIKKDKPSDEQKAVLKNYISGKHNKISEEEKSWAEKYIKWTAENNNQIASKAEVAKVDTAGTLNIEEAQRKIDQINKKIESRSQNIKETGDAVDQLTQDLLNKNQQLLDQLAQGYSGTHIPKATVDPNKVQINDFLSNEEIAKLIAEKTGQSKSNVAENVASAVEKNAPVIKETKEWLNGLNRYNS